VTASVTEIHKEKADCEKEADKAIGAVKAWADKPDIEFPKDGPKLATAKNE
jgi:hypothetical protein